MKDPKLTKEGEKNNTAFQACYAKRESPWMVCGKGFGGKVWEVLYSVSLSTIHDAVFYLRLCLYGFDLVYLWLSWAETSACLYRVAVK